MNTMIFLRGHKANNDFLKNLFELWIAFNYFVIQSAFRKAC